MQPLQDVVDTVPLAVRLAALGVAGAAAAAWLHACTPRLRPGAARLVAALPVLALCGAAPLPFRRVPSPGSAQDNDQHPPEIVTIVLVEFAFTWLCAFKVRVFYRRGRAGERGVRWDPAARATWGEACAAASSTAQGPCRKLRSPACPLVCRQVLAWACGRGPLAQRACAPLPFAAVMLAPITPSAEGSSPAGSGRRNGRQGEHAGGAATLAAAFGAKVLLVLAGLAALQLDPPLLAKEFLYSECLLPARLPEWRAGAVLEAYRTGWDCRQPLARQRCLRHPLLPFPARPGHGPSPCHHSSCSSRPVRGAVFRHGRPCCTDQRPHRWAGGVGGGGGGGGGGVRVGAAGEQQPSELPALRPCTRSHSPSLRVRIAVPCPAGLRTASHAAVPWTAQGPLCPSAGYSPPLPGYSPPPPLPPRLRCPRRRACGASL